MLQGGDPGTVLPRYPSLNKLNKCGQLIVIICLTVNYSKNFHKLHSEAVLLYYFTFLLLQTQILLTRQNTLNIKT